MSDVALPFEIEAILLALGVVGTFLFAQVSLERSKGNQSQEFRIWLAIVLVAICFVFRMWYAMYMTYGMTHLIATMALCIFPIIGYSIAKNKGAKISLLTLLASFVIFAIIVELV
jgi:hypothetical protein